MTAIEVTRIIDSEERQVKRKSRSAWYTTFDSWVHTCDADKTAGKDRINRSRNSSIWKIDPYQKA